MAPRDLALMVMICLVWAFNNIVSKLVVSHMGVPPLFFAGVRFALVAALMAPWLLPMPRPRWRLLAVSLMMGGGNFALVFIGLKQATPSAAAIVLQLAVPVTALLSYFMLGERIQGRRALGIALTVAGAFLVMWDPRGLRLSHGLIYVAAATVIGSLGMVLLKQMDRVSPLRLQAWVAFASTWPLMVLTLWLEPGQVRIGLAAGWPFVAAVLYSAVVVSVLSHTLYYSLIQRYEANLIATLTLIAPSTTILLGVMITHDQFGLRMAAGSVLALTGVLIVALRPNQLLIMLTAFKNRR